MKAIDLLATSLNQRGDNPNQDLAIKIIRSKRADLIQSRISEMDKDPQRERLNKVIKRLKNK